MHYLVNEDHKGMALHLTRWNCKRFYSVHTMRGIRGIVPLIINLSIRGVSGQFHALAAFLPKTELKVLGGPQSRWVDLNTTHISNPSQESNHDLSYPAHSEVTILTMLS